MDADTFHSEENITKMKQGIALTDEVNVFLKYTVLLLMIGSLLQTNRFHVALHLFNKRPQMMSKCGKNKKVVHEAQESVSVMFLLHFDLFAIFYCTAPQKLGICLFNMIIKETQNVVNPSTPTNYQGRVSPYSVSIILTR